ncbi:hypothetical protein [uncultured Flavobacterium sp.]|uniref:hypothetical protein n=1 Tax=uncultured Flavobacterium sp. TaxID=165435 RepID=UPI0030EB9E75|tara:strand:- start:65252 stop:65815 length:564 start_codon:yes stop_codon:yes gene_type:complete
MNKIKSLLIVFFLLILNQTISGQQFNDTSFITQEKLDSIVVFKISYQSKEFVVPLASKIKHPVEDTITGIITLPYYEDLEEVRDTVIILSRKKITEENNINLNKLLKKQSSYNKKSVALLSHYDLEVNYYKQGKIVQNIKVSTITKKIVIIKEDCEILSENESTNLCLFYSNICKKLEKFILQLTAK